MEKRNIKILLVEDDPAMLDGIKDLLEMAPLQADDILYQIAVVTAYDGLEGLQQAQAHLPDLIVSDIMMPRMTGYDFLHEVRKIQEAQQTPFIFLTAKGEKGDYEEGRLRGADLYITKPFDSDTFLEQIKTLLHRSLKLKALQQQHIEDLKRRILQILNHEFRTPLTYVTAYYEMLQDGVHRPQNIENYREYLRGIQAGCVRLATLVEDFLVVISLLSGESEEVYKQQGQPIAELPQIVWEAIQSSKKRAGKPAVEIDFKTPFSLPVIWGVRLHIHNIFERIINNAIKFSYHDDRYKPISIRASYSANEVRFSIKDYGIGLPEHIQNEIFDLFFQYNRDNMEQQGAGTGLAIASGLSKLHKGTIELISKPGEGSEFIVVFPVYTGKVQQTASLVTDQNGTSTQATILAVEDDRNLLAGLVDLLETMDESYQLDILTATNGLEGVEVLKQKVPDLIISDIMMPQMSGFEFLREIRKNLDWLHIPVIFLTARGEPADKNQAFINGVDEYITKPYESDVLLKFVKVQLDKRFRMQKVIIRSFDALKESIVNLVTPDFRQPLSFVSEYASKLTNDLENVQTGSELRESLQGIQMGSSWLKRVIEDLMSLAELKTGEAQLAHNLQKQKIANIGVMLSEFALIHERELANNGIQVRFTSMDPAIDPIVGDISTLSDSLRRLIEVGTRYVPVSEIKKEILLSVEQRASRVKLILQFPAPLPQEIFSTIEMVLHSDIDSAISRSIDLGPNLSITKGYVELHQGQIMLNNEPDEGCRFIISLPTITL